MGRGGGIPAAAIHQEHGIFCTCSAMGNETVVLSSSNYDLTLARRALISSSSSSSSSPYNFQMKTSKNFSILKGVEMGEPCLFVGANVG